MTPLPPLGRHECPACHRVLHAYATEPVVVMCPACKARFEIRWPLPPKAVTP